MKTDRKCPRLELAETERDPLLQTIRDLSLLAVIRGDAAEQALLTDAAALLRDRGIESESLLDSLVEQPSGTRPAIIQRLRSIGEAGPWVVQLAIADLPTDLRRLLESGAVTIEELAALYQITGATSITDLGWLVESGATERLGVSDEVKRRIAAALPGLRAGLARIPLGRATTIVDPLLAWLGGRSEVAWAFPAGSLRRGQDTVGDMEIVASADEPVHLIDDLCTLLNTRRLLRSARRVYVQSERGPIGVRLAEPGTAGAVLVQMTGSRHHVAALRSHGRDRGWRLDAEGLFAPGGDSFPTPREEMVYAALELPYIPPEIRGGDGEIEAAQLEHCPRSYRSRTSAATCTCTRPGATAATRSRRCGAGPPRARGPVPRHHRLFRADRAAARSLTPGDVSKQADEIARLRERYPDIAILHGAARGRDFMLGRPRRDFPDRVLSQFDIVLASLHDAANHSPARLLRRYLEAITHPLVTLITHPANRHVPNRPGYDLDYDRLFEAAIDTGTIMEIDGAPVHLDMDGALARRAVAAGVTVAISSDSHRTDAVALQMRLGILTARRGWVEPRHVLNTRPLDAVMRVLT